MANPQKEDGHLRIANELIEAFQWLHLSGNQWRLLWTILRFTYGWNKKASPISLTTFEENTGMDRRNLKGNLDILVEREIISKDGSRYITKYGLQKDYTKWQTGVEINTSVNNNTRTSVKNDTETSVKNDTHNKHKNNKNIYSEEFLEFWKNYPSRNGKKLNKKKCFSLFNKLNNQERKEVNVAVKNYAESKRVSDGYAKDPERFLKAEYWKEWLKPENERSNNGVVL